MAQIIPRGDNKWLVRIFLHRTAEGKKKFHNKVGHRTKKDAQQYARETERHQHLAKAQGNRRVVAASLNDLRQRQKPMRFIKS